MCRLAQEARQLPCISDLVEGRHRSHRTLRTQNHSSQCLKCSNFSPSCHSSKPKADSSQLTGLKRRNVCNFGRMSIDYFIFALREKSQNLCFGKPVDRSEESDRSPCFGLFWHRRCYARGLGTHTLPGFQVPQVPDVRRAKAITLNWDPMYSGGNRPIKTSTQRTQPTSSRPRIPCISSPILYLVIVRLISDSFFQSEPSIYIPHTLRFTTMFTTLRSKINAGSFSTIWVECPAG